MRNFIILLGLAVSLFSCSKVEKTFVWAGDREISAEGGTIVWTPDVKDPHHMPEFTSILIQVENVSENEIIESKIIENPDSEVEGEWYKVTGKLNEIIIEFGSNTTPFTRSITISLANPPGGYAFSVRQKPEI